MTKENKRNSFVSLTQIIRESFWSKYWREKSCITQRSFINDVTLTKRKDHEKIFGHFSYPSLFLWFFLSKITVFKNFSLWFIRLFSTFKGCFKVWFLLNLDILIPKWEFKKVHVTLWRPRPSWVSCTYYLNSLEAHNWVGSVLISKLVWRHFCMTPYWINIRILLSHFWVNKTRI